MNEARKQVFIDGLSRLEERQLKLESIQQALQQEYDRLPETKRLEDLRNCIEEAVDKLESVISELKFLIIRMKLTFSLPDEKPIATKPATEKVYIDLWGDDCDVEEMESDDREEYEEEYEEGNEEGNEEEDEPEEHVGFFGSLLAGLFGAGAIGGMNDGDDSSSSSGNWLENDYPDFDPGFDEFTGWDGEDWDQESFD